ncbi:hypothetical protein ACOMHN_009581 [Nucella lapillus]
MAVEAGVNGAGRQPACSLGRTANAWPREAHTRRPLQAHTRRPLCPAHTRAGSGEQVASTVTQTSMPDNMLIYSLLFFFVFSKATVGQIPRESTPYPSPPPTPHANKRSLSDVVLGLRSAPDDDAASPVEYDVTTPLTGQCDVRNHSGCRVEKFERCFHPGYCRCLQGYVRSRDSGNCVAAQFFQGKLSIVDTFPGQNLTPGTSDYSHFANQVTRLILRALSNDRARGVLGVRVTSVSRKERRVVVGWEVAVTRSSNWSWQRLSRTYAEGLVDLAYVDDADDLVKLNGTRFVLGANGTLAKFLHPISEFSHCVNKDYNYCDVSATCVHNLGSFTCTCRQGFDDVSPDVTNAPGERCAKSCGCQNNGTCKRDPSGNTQCQCPGWYLGSHCGVDGKEILIITCSVVGALLVLVLILCLLRHCFFNRSRRKSRGGGGGSSMAGAGSSLDSSLVKLPRVWMDAPRFYDPPPRDKRRWSYVSDPVKYIDEYMLDDYVHAGTMPLPRSQDARKKYYAAHPSGGGHMNHAYSTSTLPARALPRY